MIYLLLALLAAASACGAMYVLIPRRMPAAAILQALDAQRDQHTATARSAAGWRGQVGGHLASVLAARGVELRSLRADLALLERDLESLLAVSVLLAGGGIVFIPCVWALAYLVGLRTSIELPLWASLAAALVLVVLPALEVRRDAKSARAEFRQVVGLYLDLIAMNLEGGRGVPEALLAAAEIGHGPAFAQLRRAVTAARLAGVQPWAALGALGARIRVDELVDLAAMLGNVADQGARVRASLTERARTLRVRRTAELEEAAGGRTQSMLIAQMLLAVAFLAFLMFPALMTMVSL